MTTTTTTIDEVVGLLRQLRLPHMRRHAPEVLATAKAQRWEPAEAIRALLAEELAGRQASSINTRRKAAGFPTGNKWEFRAAGGSQAISFPVTALNAAVAEAAPDDVVLLAGKGHEEYQQIGSSRHPFSDRLQVRNLLQRRGE